MKHTSILSKLCGPAAAAFILFSSVSCIKVDGNLGGNLIPQDQLFDIYSAEFPLTQIEMKTIDSLSGYSNTRITIGAIREEEYGLTTRGCALSLVPIVDTLNFGKNPKFRHFHFTAAHDTTNFADPREEFILQGINVYELAQPMSFETPDLNSRIEHKSQRITDGLPMYNGKDSLSFEFSREFGEKYMTIQQSDLADMDTYLGKFPGIYIDMDEPEGNGGRINMFELQLGVNTSYGYVTKDFAELCFTAEYDGEQVDTSFLFYLSPNAFLDLDSLITYKSNYSSYTFPQYCFNATTHETRSREGLAKDKVYIEGGGGLKAVISAEEMLELVKGEVSKHGDPSEAIINRASIVLPFEMPEDYTQMCYYPDYITPTCRICSSDDGSVTFASLTDTSSEDEDPGERNRSLLQYAPDITYHMQQLISLKDLSKIHNYDIWTLLMSEEEEKDDSSSDDSSLSDYYSYLSYMSYYNNMYGGYGYGSYGSYYGSSMYGYSGYGGYGYNSYSNYYSYMLASMYASSTSSSSTSTSIELDKDRWFKAILNGPDAPNGRVPMLKIVYALPKK